MARASRHHESKGDEPARIVGPAALDGQAGEVDLAARQDLLGERRLGHAAWRDMRELGELGPGRKSLAQAPGPARLLDRREQFAEFAQRRHRPARERRLDARTVAEQVTEQRMGRVASLLEQQCRPLRTLDAQAERSALEHRVDSLGDPAQLAGRFEAGEESPQVVEAHVRWSDGEAAHPAGRAVRVP